MTDTVTKREFSKARGRRDENESKPVHADFAAQAQEIMIVTFDNDVRELYDMRNDFGHATDLAAKHPKKLKELQSVFDREARKYNVYPMGDDVKALLSAERPELVSGNKASYGPGTVRLPEDAVTNIKNRSFSLVAEVENPDGNPEGMLVTLGGETGGYALMVQKGSADLPLQLPRLGALRDHLQGDAAEGEEYGSL